MARSLLARSRKVAAPAVILVRPQLGVNIGTAARAMMNCGLTDLRLVQPREGWPNEHAVAPAAGAAEVLEGARVFDSVAAATADLQRVYATTWRGRELVKWVVTPRQAAAEIHALSAGGAHCGVLFGPERTGLENEDLASAQAIITVPLNPAFPSLNLAQAVLLVGYEWWLAGQETAPRILQRNWAPAATQEEIGNFLTRFFQHLQDCGFFHPPEKAEGMRQNLAATLARMDPTSQELNTLHGAVKALRFPRQRRGGLDETAGDGESGPV